MTTETNDRKWVTCTRKGWDNKQSLAVGPLVLWVIKNKETSQYSVEVKTKTDRLGTKDGLENETQAKDAALNLTRDLLSQWTQDVHSVSALPPF